MKRNFLVHWMLQPTISLSLFHPTLPKHDTKKDIIVAVIDTGVDTTHPFLRKNIWANPNENEANQTQTRLPNSVNDSKSLSNRIRDRYKDTKSLDKNFKNKYQDTNLEDNDGNGYAGDFHGWNFSSNTPDVSDSHGHGTHVAGIILQNSGKAKSRVKIMALKYYEPGNSQEANLKNTIRAIEYAVKMGAKIINYSAGGFQPSPAEREIIRWAGRKGVLVVAAAGNEAVDTDIVGFYPASYDLENVISVTALNGRDQILPSSNYGAHSVQFAARGEKMVSTLPGNHWGEMTGTSQATAVVTGKLVQIMDELKDDKDVVEHSALVLAALRRQSTSLPQLVTKTRYAKKIMSADL
ncbi:MAG: S8 family peptidase [Bdellovibrionota bacterium]